MQQVKEKVLRDQTHHACWTLPKAFYELDSRVMEAIVCCSFASFLGKTKSSDVLVEIPRCLGEGRARHDMLA